MPLVGPQMIPLVASRLASIAVTTRCNAGWPATGTITLAATENACETGLPPGRSPASMTLDILKRFFIHAIALADFAANALDNMSDTLVLFQNPRHFCTFNALGTTGVYDALDG